MSLKQYFNKDNAVTVGLVVVGVVVAVLWVAPLVANWVAKLKAKTTGA